MKMVELIEGLDAINSFELNVKKSDFKRVFGDRLGAHLFSKFAKHNYSVIGIWGYLDGWNRNRMSAMILEMAKDREDKQRHNYKKGL
jgi:hypothetical protein